MIILCLLFFLFFLVMVAYWHFDKSAFDLVNVSRAFEAGFGSNGIQFYLNENQKPSNAIILSEISPIMVYWLLLRTSLFVFLSIKMIQSALRIISSMQSLQTFYLGNIKHLRSIGLFAFFSFLLSIFNFYYSQGGFNFHFKTAFAPLILAIASYVLAEVFREGAKLVEEKNLII